MVESFPSDGLRGNALGKQGKFPGGRECLLDSLSGLDVVLAVSLETMRSWHLISPNSTLYTGTNIRDTRREEEIVIPYVQYYLINCSYRVQIPSRSTISVTEIGDSKSDPPAPTRDQVTRQG